MRKLLLMVALVISPTFAHDNLELEALFKGHTIAYNHQESRSRHANAGEIPVNHDETKPGLSDEEKKSLEKLVATIEGINSKIDAEHDHTNAFHDKTDNDADSNSGKPEFKSKFGANFGGIPGSGGGYFSGAGGSKGAGSNGGGAGGSGGSGSGNPNSGNPDVPNDTQTATAVPEPSAYLMLLAGLSLITVAVRRKSVKI